MPEDAPIECVIVPILFKGKEEVVEKAVQKAHESLDGVRMHVDKSETTPGNKFYHWEMKGVPLRIEIGPRDAASETAVLERRDNGEKKTVKISELKKEVEQTLGEITVAMKKEAVKEMASWISEAASLDEAAATLKDKGGLVRTVWCGEKSCGLEIEEVLSATLLGTNKEKPRGNCVNCKEPGKNILLIAKSY